MNCGFSKEILALYIEDDLQGPEAAERVHSHVLGCPACRQYCEQLRNSQSFIKSRFRGAPAAVSPDVLTAMRRSVMSQIGTVEQSLGWAVRLERFFMLGLRSRAYAFVGLAAVAIVSVSLLGQIRNPNPQARNTAAVFVGGNALLSPTNYRDWVVVGRSLEAGQTNVYMSPAAYHEFTRTGAVPDGAVMVREISADAGQEPGLQVSVKDSGRFQDGWGFYDFSDGAGRLRREAEPLPQSAGCLACHRDKAATDHIFTQFYPAMRGIGS